MSSMLRSADDLDRVAQNGIASLYPCKLKILIGSASCGLAAGAAQVEAAAREAVRDLGMDATVARTGCVGFCQCEPIVDLFLPQGPRISFSRMTPKRVRALLESVAKGTVDTTYALCRFTEEHHVEAATHHTYPAASDGLTEIPEWGEVPFYRHQCRVILRNSGSIDPNQIEEAIARGAYRGALRALAGSPDAVIEEVIQSGLRGRGGAGFPTGLKWKAARNSEGSPKYVVCNADEGDPGAFMDRSVLESDPHAVLEGMLIGAHAIGAEEGFVYVRSEYPLAVTTIQHAILEAERLGILGDDVLGSKMRFRVHVRRGAGAFVCGEETSLLASLEGRSGEPRPRPPYPASQGLWGLPTVINNVKTWASLGPILSRGADWYQALGAPGNTGTTVFSLVGAVKNTGLVEIPLGCSLQRMVEDVGGGQLGKYPIKAVQTGGPSGGCIPSSMLDVSVDYEKLSRAGSMMGSGGMIVLDAQTCMVDLARYFLTFTAEESCGKCTPCREGTKQMLRILTRICDGEGTSEDLSLLEQLALFVKSTSLCALGGSAPNPVLTTLRHFRQEFEAHVHEKRCPAGVCRKLVRVRIEPAKCNGCGMCVKVCAVGAVSGRHKQPHQIDQAVCTSCRACRQVCRTDAIVVE